MPTTGEVLQDLVLTLTERNPQISKRSCSKGELDHSTWFSGKCGGQASNCYDMQGTFPFFQEGMEGSRREWRRERGHGKEREGGWMEGKRTYSFRVHFVLPRQNS